MKPDDEADWARLLEHERRLEAEISALRAALHGRVDEARARLHEAAPEPALTAALAEAHERADVERHGAELRRLADEADALVQRLEAVNGAALDALAWRAIELVLAEFDGRPSAGAR